MRIIVADTQLSVRIRVKQLLVQSGSAIKVVGEASNSKQVLVLTTQLYPDVVFLESRLLKQGSQLLRHFTELARIPAVILMVKYKHQVLVDQFPIVGCLHKPLTKQKTVSLLRQAVLFQTSRVGRYTELKTDDLNQSHQRTELLIKEGDVIYRIALADIIYFKAQHNGVSIRTQYLHLLCDESMEQLELEFSNRFLRVNQHVFIAKQSAVLLEKQPMNPVFLIRFKQIDETVKVSADYLTDVKAWFKQSPVPVQTGIC